MIKDVVRLQITMQQMVRLIAALDDLKENVLPKNPQLFAVLAEAPLEDLQRLRREVNGFVPELVATA
jgi:hypothetical protein